MTKEQNDRIKQLYLETFDVLFVYAQSTLKEASLAEEAVQYTFLIACTEPERLLGSKNPKGWLLNTLRNTLCNMIRRRKRAQQYIESCISKCQNLQFQDSDTLDASLSPEVLYNNLATTEEFKLLTEYAIENKSYLEMAQPRGISLSTCRKRVQRAKEFLRKKLENDVII